MRQKLVIVESPAKAKTIEKLLSKEYKVVASNGHVRDLPKSQLGVDVEHNFAPKYITIRGRGDIIKNITKEAKNADRVLLATDPDREGEAISWHLATALGIDASSDCRVEFNEITGKAIKEAVKHPRPLNADLVNAQQARRILDRLVGYKISPLLWAKVKKGLSAGRVQSVATRIIVDREREIAAFVPEEYWTIVALLTGESGEVFEAKLAKDKGKKVKIGSEAESNSYVERLQKADFVVQKIARGEKFRSPAPPFTTSNLQQEASRKLGFTTRRTMLVAQQLYEGVEIKGKGALGLVTYIRTDSARISEEAFGPVREYIQSAYGEDYLPDTPNRYRSKKNAQDAHEAIRPTMIELTPQSIKDSLSPEQFKLYRLIYNRFVASQMTKARIATVQMDIAAEEMLLRASSERVAFKGFMAAYTEGKDEEEEKTATSLPQLKESSSCKLEKVTPAQHFTQPPARYTEAMLVRALEEKGIGRPSTYAPTISTILERGYVRSEKKVLHPTLLGEIVTDIMIEFFGDIVDVEFTAAIEEQLDSVASGEKQWTQVLGDFYAPFEHTLEAAEKNMEKIKIADEVSEVPCDKCGTMMVYKIGRYGKFLACPRFPECRNTKPILDEIGVGCPKCDGQLIRRRSKGGRRSFYGCSNYPNCDFVSWDQPVEKKCPQCGKFMVQKGQREIQCSDKACGYKEQVAPKAKAKAKSAAAVVEGASGEKA